MLISFWEKADDNEFKSYFDPARLSLKIIISAIFIVRT